MVCLSHCVDIDTDSAKATRIKTARALAQIKAVTPAV